MTNRKLTLKDVAKILSVSPSTISKALRDSDDISSKMKELVKSKTEEIGYRPNILARTLINNRSKLIGIMVPDLRISFFSEAIRGMYEEANKKGYEAIILVHDENPVNEKKKLEFLSGIHVDGILLNAVGSNTNYQLYRQLSEEGIKIVCWDRKILELGFSSVTINDKLASYQLTLRMIKSGRKNILFLGPNTGIPVAKDRYEGYLSALKKNHIPFNPDLFVQTFRDDKDSYNKMKSILKAKIKVDGLISIGGLITYGAGKAILDRDISIPRDIMIGEFGDNNIVARLGVPYYTVNQNPFKLGITSMDLLIDMIETNKPNYSNRNIIIESKVIQR